MTQFHCTPNINQAERTKRLLFGLGTLVLALLFLIVLLVFDASRWWRLPLFFLFWGAAVGIFQWRDKT
jgi:hypothetical protein